MRLEAAQASQSEDRPLRPVLRHWWLLLVCLLLGQGNMCSAGFDGLDAVPSVFVLMGNFQSSSCGAPSTNYVAVKGHFAALAAMISQHKNLMVRQSELPFSSSGAGPCF